MIECGKVGRPWGIRGQVVVFWNSGRCPIEAGCGEVYTRGADGGYIPHFILGECVRGKKSVVSLRGIKDPKAASTLTNKYLYIPEDVLKPLCKDEYYCYQILGLRVETEGGQYIGRVVKIFTAGYNDVYEVERLKGKTVLIPAIKGVVIKVDIEKGLLIIRPMQGML